MTTVDKRFSIDSLLKSQQNRTHSTDSQLRDTLVGWRSCTFFYLLGDDNFWYSFGLSAGVLVNFDANQFLPDPLPSFSIAGNSWYCKDREDGLYHKLSVVGGALTDVDQVANHPSPPLADIITDDGLFISGGNEYHLFRVVGGTLQDSYTTANLPPIVGVQETTDSLLKRVDVQLQHSADSYLAHTVDRYQSIDSLLRATKDLTHTTDALLKKLTDRTHSVDSLLRATQSLLHAADSLLKKIDNELKQSIDSLLKRPDSDVRFGTDSYLQSVSFSTIDVRQSVDSLLKKLNNELGQSTSSALKKIDQQLQQGTDSLLQQQSDKTASTDSLLKKLAELQQSVDSALKKIDQPAQHSTDSHLKQQVDRTYFADSLLRKQNAVTHGMDSFLKKLDLPHSTDSLLELGTAPVAYGIAVVRLRGSVKVSDPTTPSLVSKVLEHQAIVVLDQNKNMLLEGGKSLFLWPTHGSRVTRVGTPYYQVLLTWYGAGGVQTLHQKWLLDSSVTGVPKYSNLTVLGPER